jgi:hypothetical protein
LKGARTSNINNKRARRKSLDYKNMVKMIQDTSQRDEDRRDRLKKEEKVGKHVKKEDFEMIERIVKREEEAT